MGLGFFGKRQERFQFTTKGGAGASGINQVRRLGIKAGVYNQSPPCPVNLVYDSSNTGALPAEQNLAVLQSFNAGETRGRLDSSYSDVSLLGVGFKTRSVDAQHFTYLSNAALSPPTRTLTVILHRPELIEYMTWAGTNSANSTNIEGVFNMPFFENLKSMYIAGNVSQMNPITAINGRWSERLELLVINNNSTITSIQKKLPKSLTVLGLGINNATFAAAANVNQLIADCVNVKILVFTAGNTSVTNTLSMPFSGVLNIAHMAQLERFQIASAALTNITHSITALKNLVLKNCTSLNAATFLNLFNTFLATANHEWIDVSGSNRAISRTLVDADFKNTLTMFYAYGNAITGNLTLTTSRPNITAFRVGNVGLTDQPHNVMSAVDVSGLTHADMIDVGYSDIETLNLPVNTVCTLLGLGGNKLDIANNPNLISQILAMTSLQDLRLSAGGAGRFDAAHGQNSAGGFGANLNLSALTALTILNANFCQLSGALTLPPSIDVLVARENNLSSIVSSSGSFPAATNIQIQNNAGLDFDFTKTPAVVTLAATGSGVTIIDISNRSATSLISQIAMQSSSSLVEIRFPSNTANAIFTNTGTVQLLLNGNPNLSLITGLENISWTTFSGNNRQAIFHGCNLSTQDFKVGINNFLPSVIQIQNNNMTQAAVDLNITNMYNNRTKWNTTVTAKSLNIGGTNAAPTGVYQAPAGFVLGSNDGTPASVKEMVYVLVNNYGWTITMN